MDELFEKRKKIIYEFICDEFYVPMKLKELSMLLQVPKDQKGELKAVMDSLEKEGRVHVTQKGKYIKGEAKQLRGMFQANARGFGFLAERLQYLIQFGLCPVVYLIDSVKDCSVDLAGIDPHFDSYCISIESLAKLRPLKFRVVHT